MSFSPGMEQSKQGFVLSSDGLSTPRQVDFYAQPLDFYAVILKPQQLPNSMLEFGKMLLSVEKHPDFK